jgi:hypothetical protein
MTRGGFASQAGELALRLKNACIVGETMVSRFE